MNPEMPPARKASDYDPTTLPELELEVDATEVVLDSTGPGSEAEIGRRRFFQRLIGLIAGVVALGWAVPLLVYGIRPTLRRRSPEWFDAGALGQLAVNHPRELDVVVSRRDGWRQVTAVSSPCPRSVPTWGARTTGATPRAGSCVRVT